MAACYTGAAVGHICVLIVLFPREGRQLAGAGRRGSYTVARRGRSCVGGVCAWPQLTKKQTAIVEMSSEMSASR